MFANFGNRTLLSAFAKNIESNYIKVISDAVVKIIEDKTSLPDISSSGGMLSTSRNNNLRSILRNLHNAIVLPCHSSKDLPENSSELAKYLGFIASSDSKWSSIRLNVL